MLLRSTRESTINIPHKYWKKLGWKLNDIIEIDYGNDNLIIKRKGETNG